VNYKCRSHDEKVHTEVHMGPYRGIVESTSYTNTRNPSYSLDDPKLVIGHGAFTDPQMLPSLMTR